MAEGDRQYTMNSERHAIRILSISDESYANLLLYSSLHANDRIVLTHSRIYYVINVKKNSQSLYTSVIDSHIDQKLEL